jgi:fructose-bisphosphate aldolase class II
LKNNFIYGTNNQELYKLAKQKKFALPAINVSGTNTINSVLETASELNSPVIIQFSNGGSQFIAGKGMPNKGLNSSISGSIAGAYHIHKTHK